MPILKMPINGVLDLHTFLPKEVKFLLEDYIDECLAKGITDLRIIHGKGRGDFRRTVHSFLSKSNKVQQFQIAPPEAGHWGATLVKLKVPK
ncbi:MAG: Smr/MutS family protein [Candidatus Riflebacteria bacterium]|nr:Smr/MutS family protein [Candidatus Riflebacteria bacterium]